MATKCNLSDILFDVEKTPFLGKCNSDYAFDIFGTINGEKTRLNACSDRYELVKNEDIFLPIRQTLLDAGISFTEQYEHTDYARFYANYKFNDGGIKIGQSNDLIFPRLEVRHSYNGLTKYSIVFGYFRLVCSNGLVIPVEEKEQSNFQITGKHTQSINTSFDTLKEKIHFFVNNLKIASEGFNKMAEIWVADPKQRLEEVTNAVGIKKGFDDMFNIMMVESSKLGERYEGGKVNDWLIYNAINNYVHNDANNKKAPEARYKIDQEVIDYMLIH